MPLLTTYIENSKISECWLSATLCWTVLCTEKWSGFLRKPRYRYLSFIMRKMLGGAGNVAANLTSLGVHCDFIGIIGKDEAGRSLSGLLSAVNVHSHLLRLADYPTIVKPA